MMSSPQSYLAMQEHNDHAFGAQFDDIRERYSDELRSLRVDDAITAEHDAYMDKVWQAGFGDDADAYEADWKRTINHIKSVL